MFSCKFKKTEMEAKNNRASMLEKQLKPLYAEVLQDVASINYNKCTFCPQWGEHFPLEDKCGILVVGRACNGWHSTSQDINVLFGDSEESIFNREDQMRWVEDCAGNKENYNTNNSAFWRVTKRIAQCFYQNDWYSHIAWSNVCKVAPWEGGNPNDKLYYAQLPSSQKIFETEIRLLSPKVVVMFTGYDWAVDFLCFLNNCEEPQSIMCLNWDKYTCDVFQIKGIYFIVSRHPQGKKETPHTECIINIIRKAFNNAI